MKSGLPYDFNRQEFINKFHASLLPIPFKYASNLFTDYDVFNFVHPSTRITIANPFKMFIYGIEFYILWSTQGCLSCKIMMFINPECWTSKVLKESGWFNIVTLLDDFDSKPENITNYQYMLNQSKSWIIMTAYDLYARARAKVSTIPEFNQIAANWIIDFNKEQEKNI